MYVLTAHENTCCSHACHQNPHPGVYSYFVNIYTNNHCFDGGISANVEIWSGKDGGRIANIDQVREQVYNQSQVNICESECETRRAPPRQANTLPPCSRRLMSVGQRRVWRSLLANTVSLNFPSFDAPPQPRFQNAAPIADGPCRQGARSSCWILFSALVHTATAFVRTCVWPRALLTLLLP